MKKIQFRVDGLTEEDIQRWQNSQQPSIRTAKTLITSKIMVVLAVAAIVIYSTGSMTPVAEIAGNIFRGKNVLVMIDRSGSMKGTEKTLKTHCEQLISSGMLLQKYDVEGFGISTTGDRPTLLQRIEEALLVNPNVDTVYVFSDFHNLNKLIDSSDEPGYQRLRQLLRERGLRLYLGTVKENPEEPLIKIAKESGGDLIDTTKVSVHPSPLTPPTGGAGHER